MTPSAPNTPQNNTATLQQLSPSLLAKLPLEQALSEQASLEKPPLRQLFLQPAALQRALWRLCLCAIFAAFMLPFAQASNYPAPPSLESHYHAFSEADFVDLIAHDFRLPIGSHCRYRSNPPLGAEHGCIDDGDALGFYHDLLRNPEDPECQQRVPYPYTGVEVLGGAVVARFNPGHVADDWAIYCFNSYLADQQSGYGVGRTHTGVDWNIFYGSHDQFAAVHAIADGRVFADVVSEGGMRSLFLLHRLPEGSYLLSEYGHITHDYAFSYGFYNAYHGLCQGGDCEQCSSCLRRRWQRGDIVRRGDVVGFLSGTGGYTPHLHFALFREYPQQSRQDNNTTAQTVPWLSANEGLFIKPVETADGQEDVRLVFCQAGHCNAAALPGDLHLSDQAHGDLRGSVLANLTPRRQALRISSNPLWVRNSTIDPMLFYHAEKYKRAERLGDFIHADLVQNAVPRTIRSVSSPDSQAPSIRELQQGARLEGTVYVRMEYDFYGYMSVTLESPDARVFHLSPINDGQALRLQAQQLYALPFVKDSIHSTAGEGYRLALRHSRYPPQAYNAASMVVIGSAQNIRIVP